MALSSTRAPNYRRQFYCVNAVRFLETPLSAPVRDVYTANGVMCGNIRLARGGPADYVRLVKPLGGVIIVLLRFSFRPRCAGEEEE